nr:hypothetical protein [Tanacetum cinerariifolium]
GRDTLQGSAGLLKIQEGMAAMTGVFKQKRSLPTMLLWPSHLQVLLLKIMSDESLPLSLIYDRYQLGNGYHVVPPPYTGTFMPPKPELVFNNAPNNVETDHPAFNVMLSPPKPDQDLSDPHRPSAPIIEDWVSNSEDKSETKTPQNVSSFVHPTKQVKYPRPFVQHVEIFIPPATLKTAIQKPTSNGKRRNRKACFVCKSLDHLIKDYDYHEKKMAQPTARRHAQRGHHIHYSRMTLQNPQRHVVPAAVLTQSKLVPINVVRLVSTIVPKISVTRPRQVNNETCPIYLILRSSMVDMLPLVEIQRVVKFLEKMYDKKNSVLFTDTGCLVLSPEFKLPDEIKCCLESLGKTICTMHVVPVAVLTQSKLVPINVVRPVSTIVPKISVTRPRQVNNVVTKSNSPPRRHINHSPSLKASTYPPKVTAVKAPMVNVAQVVQGKWEWKPKCQILDHVSRNTCALMTLKRFDYNDALGRSKSVMAWVPKRN